MQLDVLRMCAVPTTSKVCPTIDFGRDGDQKVQRGAEILLGI